MLGKSNMSRQSTVLTGAAGEHYVAYKLSVMGYAVAMTRGGSPTVDLMVGDLSGNAVSIQVKTSSWARRAYVRSNAKNHWEWDVGHKVIGIRSESILYAFVDLKVGSGQPPDVFIVPSRIVADVIKPEFKRAMFWIWDISAEHFLERWDYIATQLKPIESEPKLET